jgi:ligand-binding SRPBCC domain-containing protein
MATVRTRSWVAAPIDEVFAFFDDPANLARLMPPPVAIRLERVEPVPPRRGSIFEFRYGLGPVQRTWVVRLVDREEGRRFVDVTLDGPVQRFVHTHRFEPSRRGTWIIDVIDLQVGPGGRLGDVLDLAASIVIRLTMIWRAVRQRVLLPGDHGTVGQ